MHSRFVLFRKLSSASRSFCNAIIAKIIAYQLCAYAGSEFLNERQLWETRAAPRPTYLWSGTCPLQLRAYTQIPSCRRISSGLIAQVALLPFRGGGPPSPRGQHPILGLRKRVPYSTVKCNDYGEYIEYWADIPGWQVKIWKVNQGKGNPDPVEMLISYCHSTVGIGGMT